MNENHRWIFLQPFHSQTGTQNVKFPTQDQAARTRQREGTRLDLGFIFHPFDGLEILKVVNGKRDLKVKVAQRTNAGSRAVPSGD